MTQTDVPQVAVVLGTFTRQALLQQALESFRASCGDLSHTFVVVDGGSTDGTKEWLLEQPDVSPIFQHLPLSGAVKAFNLGFAFAVDAGFPWIAALNDDDQMHPEPGLQRAVEMMQADEAIGAVAFETDLRGGWAYEEWNGRPYANKGIFRREAGMAAARAAGDPEGRCWWCRDHHTYASDTELGLWIWRLGWTIAKGGRLHDNARNDPHSKHDVLRGANLREYMRSGTVKLFEKRWTDPKNVEYNRADAEAFGGRLL